MDINFIITTLFFNKAYQYVILKTLYIIIIHNGIQNFSAWHLYSEFWWEDIYLQVLKDACGHSSRYELFA